MKDSVLPLYCSKVTRRAAESLIPSSGSDTTFFYECLVHLPLIKPLSLTRLFYLPVMNPPLYTYQLHFKLSRTQLTFVIGSLLGAMCDPEQREKQHRSESCLSRVLLRGLRYCIRRGRPHMRYLPSPTLIFSLHRHSSTDRFLLFASR